MLAVTPLLAAAYPTTVFLIPVVLSTKACPTEIFSTPVVFAPKESEPIATLFVPDVFASNALKPIAVLLEALFAFKAAYPTPTLLLDVTPEVNAA